MVSRPSILSWDLPFNSLTIVVTLLPFDCKNEETEAQKRCATFPKLPLASDRTGSPVPMILHVTSYTLDISGEERAAQVHSLQGTY